MDPVTLSQIAIDLCTAGLGVATIVLAIATICLERGTAQQSRISLEIVEENRALDVYCRVHSHNSLMRPWGRPDTLSTTKA